MAGKAAVNITVMLPLDLACGELRFGVIETDPDVAVVAAEPSGYPVLVVVIVTVELVTGATPLTVTKPEPLIDTEPDAVAVPAHVYKVLLLLML